MARAGRFYILPCGQSDYCRRVRLSTTVAARSGANAPDADGHAYAGR